MWWFLIEIAQHLGAIWQPQNVHKPMKPKTCITTGTQTLLIVRTEM